MTFNVTNRVEFKAAVVAQREMFVQMARNSSSANSRNAAITKGNKLVALAAMFIAHCDKGQRASAWNMIHQMALFGIIIKPGFETKQFAAVQYTCEMPSRQRIQSNIRKALADVVAYAQKLVDEGKAIA